MSGSRKLLLGALVLAVVLRVEYLRELLMSPFGRHLLLDAQWYDQAARRLLEGVPLAPGEAYFRPPLYPMFLAGIYKVFQESLVAPRVAQMLLGVAQVWMCWRIAFLTHGRRTAIVTAYLAATYGMFVYFEAEILTTALGAALTTAAALLLLEGDRRGKPLYLFAGGGAIGLAAIVHASALVLAPVAVAWVFSRELPRASRRVLVAAAAVAIGVLLPVSAVTVRNAAASGEFVLIGSQGGINFYIGNNPVSDGKSALAPGFAEAAQVMHHEEYRDTVEVAGKTLAERELGRPLTAGEVSRYWFEEGRDWFRTQPKAALTLLMRKVVFFWSSFEISNNRDLRDQARRFTPILRIFLVQFALLLPLAIYGLIRGGVSRREPWLLIGFLVVYTAAIAAFFVCARYRQPAVVWLLPFAASGALAFVDDARRAKTDPRRILLPVGILALLFLVTNAAFLTRTGVANVTAEKDAPFHRYNLAVLFEREGNLDRAIDEYRAAAATGVQDPRVHLNLGNTLARTGRSEEAREEYRKVLRIAPDYESAVRSNLGILATQEGDWNEAIRQFEECLRIDPGNGVALRALAVSLLSAGRFDEAIVALRRALTANAGGEAELRRSLSVAYLETGLLEDSEREALRALRLAPQDVVAVLTLGKVYARRGDREEAEAMWKRARAIAPGVPAVERAIEEGRANAE
jgi:tetratricopeptide (TPR) repeat protein